MELSTSVEAMVSSTKGCVVPFQSPAVAFTAADMLFPLCDEQKTECCGYFHPCNEARRANGRLIVFLIVLYGRIFGAEPVEENGAAPTHE